MNPDWDGVMKGKAREAKPVKSPRPVVEASGDRSLLRAPTPSEFMKARARQLVMIARENAWTDEQLAGQILDEVYAVDGLRGTEDRALREKIATLAGADLLEIARGVEQAGGLMMQWPSKLRETLVRVLLRESVE